MPGPVWTMAFWFALLSLTLLMGFLFPMNAGANVLARVAMAVYGVGVVVLLAAMQERTPAWFLHAQTLVTIALTLWLVKISVSSAGAVASSLGLIVVAAYMAWWLMKSTALAYMLLACVGLLAAYGASARLPELAVPWLFVSAISLGLIWSIGILVAQLNAQLVTDPLTGVLNRSGLVTFLNRRSRTLLTAEPRTLVAIDLDNFKGINDRYGHLAGDRTLAEFGTALRTVIRPHDTAFRSGGDEFVVILAHTDEEGGLGFARRLHAASSIEWSYGLTEWPAIEDFATALARADRLMYEQKTDGVSRAD